MSGPLTPNWARPSHPDVQEVIISDAGFTSKSLSKIALPPHGVFAKLDFPPCTPAYEPTYATVQMGRAKHLNLNSDLLYINHSCEPSLIFDLANLVVTAGPNGLQPGDELTFFYPSSEWAMDHAFDCLCGTPSCRGRISGARDMTDAQLQGVWLNKHIRELLAEKKAAAVAAATNGGVELDQSVQTLREKVRRAEQVLEAARQELDAYIHGAKVKKPVVSVYANGAGINGASAGGQRRGPTSRELSGEMGGDTSA